MVVITMQPLLLTSGIVNHFALQSLVPTSDKHGAALGNLAHVCLPNN